MELNWHLVSLTARLFRCILGLFLIILAGGHVFAQSCLTVQPKTGSVISQISEDGSGKLSVKIAGAFEITGDTTGFSIVGSGSETVLERAVPQGSVASITRLLNQQVRVCVQDTGLPSNDKSASAQADPGKQTKASTIATPVPIISSKQDAQQQTPVASSDSSTKKSCLKTSSNCDIAKTLSDVAPPDSPAFDVLGIAPKEVNTPTSPTDFATSVLNSFDQRGNFQTGTAIDIAPFFLLGKRTRFLAHYSDHDPGYLWVRPLARTTLSYGTTKGTSDPDKAVRLAFGVRTVLFDEADPRLLFDRCVQEFSPDANQDPQEQLRKLKDKRNSCVTQSARHIWNASSLVIAAAPSWISKTGNSGDFTRNGGGYWSSAALRLSDWGQIAGVFRRRTGEQIPGSSAADAVFVTQNSTVVGGTFRFGKGTFNGNFEGVYIHTKKSGLIDSHPEFGFGVERKLTDNLFLEAQYRYATGINSGASGILTNLKWSFSKQPNFLPQNSSDSAPTKQTAK